MSQEIEPVKMHDPKYSFWAQFFPPVRKVVLLPPRLLRCDRCSLRYSSEHIQIGQLHDACRASPHGRYMSVTAS